MSYYNPEFIHGKLLLIAGAIVVISLAIFYWMYNPNVHNPPPAPQTNSQTTQQ